VTLSDLAKYSMTRSARGLSAIAEFLVWIYRLFICAFSCGSNAKCAVWM